jgi:hypothetical protein
MKYYRLSDAVLLNLNHVESIKPTHQSIHSDYQFVVTTVSGSSFHITVQERDNILKQLENSNLVN